MNKRESAPAEGIGARCTERRPARFIGGRAGIVVCELERGHKLPCSFDSPAEQPSSPVTECDPDPDAVRQALHLWEYWNREARGNSIGELIKAACAWLRGREESCEQPAESAPTSDLVTQLQRLLAPEDVRAWLNAELAAAEARGDRAGYLRALHDVRQIAHRGHRGDGFVYLEEVNALIKKAENG